MECILLGKLSGNLDIELLHIFYPKDEAKKIHKNYGEFLEKIKEIVGVGVDLPYVYSTIDSNLRYYIKFPVSYNKNLYEVSDNKTDVIKTCNKFNYIDSGSLWITHELFNYISYFDNFFGYIYQKVLDINIHTFEIRYEPCIGVYLRYTTNDMSFFGDSMTECQKPVKSQKIENILECFSFLLKSGPKSARK